MNKVKCWVPLSRGRNQKIIRRRRHGRSQSSALFPGSSVSPALLQRHVVQTPDRTWRMLCVARHSSLRCTSNHIREKPSINEYAPCHWVGSNPSVLSVRQTNHTRAHEGGRKGRQTACARKSRSIVFMCRLPLNMSKLPLHTYRY